MLPSGHFPVFQFLCKPKHPDSELKSISYDCRVQHFGLSLSCAHHSYWKHTYKHYTHTHRHFLPIRKHPTPPAQPTPWSPGSLCHSLTLSRLWYELNDSSDASPRSEGATARSHPPPMLEGQPEALLCTLIITSMVVAGCHNVVVACTHPKRVWCVSGVRLSWPGCLMF